MCKFGVCDWTESPWEASSWYALGSTGASCGFWGFISWDVGVCLGGGNPWCFIWPFRTGKIIWNLTVSGNVPFSFGNFPLTFSIEASVESMGWTLLGAVLLFPQLHRQSLDTQCSAWGSPKSSRISLLVFLVCPYCLVWFRSLEEFRSWFWGGWTQLLVAGPGLWQ